MKKMLAKVNPLPNEAGKTGAREGTWLVTFALLAFALYGVAMKDEAALLVWAEGKELIPILWAISYGSKAYREVRRYGAGDGPRFGPDEEGM